MKPKIETKEKEVWKMGKFNKFLNLQLGSERAPSWEVDDGDDDDGDDDDDDVSENVNYDAEEDVEGKTDKNDGQRRGYGEMVTLIDNPCYDLVKLSYSRNS